MVDLEHTLPRTARRPPRRRSRFERWAWDQVLSFRIGLAAAYVGLVYYGVTALLANPPVFEVTAPEGWAPVWASIIILAGSAATIGSVSDSAPFRRVELVADVALFVTLVTYSVVLHIIGYAHNDVGRESVGAGFAALSVGPTVRMLWLASQIRKRRA